MTFKKYKLYGNPDQMDGSVEGQLNKDQRNSKRHKIIKTKFTIENNKILLFKIWNRDWWDIFENQVVFYLRYVINLSPSCFTFALFYFPLPRLSFHWLLRVCKKRQVYHTNCNILRYSTTENREPIWITSTISFFCYFSFYYVEFE